MLSLGYALRASTKLPFAVPEQPVGRSALILGLFRPRHQLPPPFIRHRRRSGSLPPNCATSRYSLFTAKALAFALYLMYQHLSRKKGSRAVVKKAANDNLPTTQQVGILLTALCFQRPDFSGRPAYPQQEPNSLLYTCRVI